LTGRFAVNVTQVMVSNKRLETGTDPKPKTGPVGS
jgi:hypothetical protein